MKQITFYKWVTGILVLLNTSLLLFITLRPPTTHHFPSHPPPPHTFEQGEVPMIQSVTTLLQLDKRQSKQFTQMAMSHKEKVARIEEQQKELLKPYFDMLVGNQSIDKDSIMHQVSVLEKDKIELTYQHFEEVKAILNTEQLKAFPRFMNTVLAPILLHSDGHPPPPSF